jgi:hypothetical protein
MMAVRAMARGGRGATAAQGGGLASTMTTAAHNRG